MDVVQWFSLSEAMFFAEGVFLFGGGVVEWVLVVAHFIVWANTIKVESYELFVINRRVGKIN